MKSDELKVYKGDVTIPVYGTIADAEVYLKSEADKVIAELKADYKEACGRLQTANLIKDEQLAATRHQKYKRCLAMKQWCYDRWIRAYHSNKLEKTRFYVRWQKRWLELAEVFK